MVDRAAVYRRKVRFRDPLTWCCSGLSGWFPENIDMDPSTMFGHIVINGEPCGEVFWENRFVADVEEFRELAFGRHREATWANLSNCIREPY